MAFFLLEGDGFSSTQRSPGLQSLHIQLAATKALLPATTHAACWVFKLSTVINILTSRTKSTKMGAVSYKDNLKHSGKKHKASDMLDGEGVQAGSKALKKKSHDSEQEIDELAVEDYNEEEGQSDTASEQYHEEGEDVGEGSHRTGKSVNKGKAVADEFIGGEVTTANKFPPKVWTGGSPICGELMHKARSMVPNAYALARGLGSRNTTEVNKWLVDNLNFLHSNINISEFEHKSPKYIAKVTQDIQAHTGYQIFKSPGKAHYNFEALEKGVPDAEEI
ncbi:hypothetical protein SCLCIDRAFT_8607 [Scleroderma citrinum Foug A]|uniref:Uncharacterized protein n=1 Tax=Scleroderma citrinum Foug A TaxID=1036808 RepID=A0A0C2ZRA3_9AGAM|nr:hypothetical protein SCLCIDRAFT_8607 [Scleroderma citrinum Foug A]